MRVALSGGVAPGYYLVPLQGTWVAHTLLFMYALRQHVQHLCPPVLTSACPGFLTVADIKGNVGATRESSDRGR